MPFYSTKTYGHEVGLSVAFRQWRAKSHCHHVHGYAVAVSLVFSAQYLDDNNWAVDFGSLGPIREMLQQVFDHTVVVAQDDPELRYFQEGNERGILRLIVLPHVGCEKFAEYIFNAVNDWMHRVGLAPRCALESVEVREHGANSAIYKKGC